MKIKGAIEAGNTKAVLDIVPEMSKYHINIGHVRAALSSMTTQHMVRVSQDLENNSSELSEDIFWMQESGWRRREVKRE